MPIVTREGELEFRVYIREAAYEPPPHKRRAIREAYVRHAAEIRRKWDEIHGARREGKEGS